MSMEKKSDEAKKKQKNRIDGKSASFVAFLISILFSNAAETCMYGR
jgi:hypothetical protein